MSISEKMRSWANKAYAEDKYPSAVAILDEMEIGHFSKAYECRLFLNIADAIDKEIEYAKNGVEQDTQEKIDADSRKLSVDYWKCFQVPCHECPAKIEGKSPDEYYDADNCTYAQMIDLLRRQCELDEKKMEGKNGDDK